MLERQLHVRCRAVFYGAISLQSNYTSRQKEPAAAKTSETGRQEDETRSHREHVCSASYLAGTEHARSSGTKSTRLYQRMRRGGAGTKALRALFVARSTCQVLL